MRTAQKGFTLIELLVVISIVTIITAAIIPNFNTYIDRQYIGQAREQIKDDIRNLQNRALNGESAMEEITPGEEVNYWGMKLENESGNYSTFISTELNCTDTTKYEVIRTSSLLPGGTVVKSGDGCIFFSFSNGDSSFVPSGVNPIIVGPPGSITSGCMGIELGSNGFISNSTDENCN